MLSETNISNLSTEQKYARIFGLPEEDIAHADYSIFTNILTVTYGIDKPRYKQRKVTQRASKEFADFFEAPIFMGKGVDYILDFYLKEKGRGSEFIIREPFSAKVYYTSSDPVFGKMTMRQFIETEVTERGNYTLADVQNWMRKYNISENNPVIWVSPKKWVANRYNLFAEEWDKAKYIPESEMRVYEIKGNEGFIIPESDDGDEGYLFVFKSVMNPVIREAGNQGTAPDQHEKVKETIEKIRKEPLTASEKRAKIERELSGIGNEIDRIAITELRNFRPLGRMSELGAAMGAEPRKGVRIDTPYGPYVFDEKRIPSNERVDRWVELHKEAEAIRTLAVEYGFGLGASPNTVTGNFRVVERGRRFKEQGLLSPEEEQALNALEKYWQEHPELDRQKGYGIWGHNLEIMVPESLRKNMIEKKVSAWKRNYEQIDAFLRHSEVRTIEGAKAFKEGIKQLYPLLIDMPGKEANELRQQILEMDKIAMNTLEALKRQPVKPEPEVLLETTQTGIRAGDTIIHKTAKYTAVVDKIYKNGNADITVVEAKGIPEWEKSIKEGFPIKTTVKGVDIDRYFEKAAIKGTEAKQPWQMTRSEAIAEAARPLGPMGISWGEMRTALSTSRKFAESLHKDMVKLAIVEGKPVPAEVLRDYPDLATIKKQPWEMTYREFADFFQDVWGGQKFTFAERVGKPMGIQSQAGEPYHMIKGKRIGYSGSLERDRWRLAIVDKALSEGKTVPEEVLAELSESLKHEKEKLGGTGMAEQYEEKPPGQEVRDWMKRALGIEDYKGGRHDRIQMLALLIQNSELGNIRSISDSGSMALALGKDLGYGTPPAYGMSLERYYAEKIAAETGKEVPIIKSSVVVKPPAKELDVQAIFNRYTAGYSRLSLVAVTQLSDIKLAEDLMSAIPELSKDDALKIAPQVRGLAYAKIKEIEAEEVIAPKIPVFDFWGEVKDLKITDVQVEFAPGEPSRGYKNIYLYTYAILENGKRVRMNEEIFKGRDVTEAQKMGEEQFRQRKLYMIGETVEKNVRESSFLNLNRYEEYVKQAPVAVQKRFEEPGAIAGGAVARHILRITEPEGYYFGTQVEVMQGVDPELEPYFTGTIKRMLNNGELVEVHPEGDPREVSVRVPVDRVNVTRLVQQEGAEPKKIKKLYRYYYAHRPPGIGTQPGGFINHESWLPATTTPHGRKAFGWVEYDRPLTPEEISGYELFEDEVELPKLVKELVQFAHDEGIDEAMKVIDAEYGRAVWDWLKAQKRLRTRVGQKEQIRDEIMRLAGITAPPPAAPPAVPQEAPAVEIKTEMKPIPLPAVEIKSLPPLESIEDINELKKRENDLQDLWNKIDLAAAAYDKEIRTLRHTIPDPGKRLNRALELDKEKYKLIDKLSNVGRELRLVRDKIKSKEKESPPAVPASTEELNRKFGALVVKAKSMWTIRDVQGWIDRYNDPRRNREDTIHDLEGLIQTMEIRQPAIEMRYNAYISSTLLQTGALASPKFLSDERMAQDIERNIQVSIEEARALVPQFRAIAEKKIGKEQIESVKETFGIDLEQEAHKLGIDLADYAIVPAGNKVVLAHKTIVQRRYEIKPPAGYMEEREQKLRAKPISEKPEERILRELRTKYRFSRPEGDMVAKAIDSYIKMRDKSIVYSILAPVRDGKFIADELMNTIEITYYGAKKAPEPAEKPKESWQMTKDEYARQEWFQRTYGGLTGANREAAFSLHKVAVMQALEAGKPVPSEVLKDYPDIVRPSQIKPVQSIQEIKQQVISSIQAASTVEELQPILKGIGFLPLPEPEKRQVMDLYQNKYSMLMSERPFGAPVKVEEKPKAIGALTPQQLFEAELRRKAEESRRVRATPTLTGGAVTARRLEMFEPGAMEKAKAEAEARKRIEQLGLPFGVHPVIKRLAESPQEVLKFGNKRAKDTVEDIVLRRYVQYCPPGTIIDNRAVPKVPEKWWVYPPKLRTCITQVEQKLAGAGMVRESQRYRYSIYQDRRLFANEDDPTEANNIYEMLVRTYPKSAVELRENFVHPRIHQRTLKQYPAPGEISVVREATQLTSSMRSYIQGAQAVKDVIHYFRDGRPPIRGVLYRTRDRRYFVEASDGQIYDSMGWEDVEAQQPYITEHTRYAGGYARTAVRGA